MKSTRIQSTGHSGFWVLVCKMLPKSLKYLRVAITGSAIYNFAVCCGAGVEPIVQAAGQVSHGRFHLSHDLLASDAVEKRKPIPKRHGWRMHLVLHQLFVIVKRGLPL
jgi:hypothetical protein